MLAQHLEAKNGDAVGDTIAINVSGASIGDDEFLDFVRAQFAHFKIPRYIKFVDTFPTTATGKVQKFMIRAAMIEELGLRKAAS